MGDIGTHHEIGLSVARSLAAALPKQNLAYMLLGNFLTDVSQFRDPFAYMSAKGRVRSESPAARLDTFDKWLDEMFGTPGGIRHGAVGTFFLHMCRAFTHDRFGEFGAVQPTDAENIRPLEPAEIDSLYNASFTQYYPHEHMDLPPYVPEEAQSRNTLYRIGARKLLNYLEEQIEYIAGELLALDGALGSKVPEEIPPAHLVRLGHTLHAVEDFFFHSNHLELMRLRRVLAGQPTGDDAPADPIAAAAKAPFAGTRLAGLGADQDRHVRRLLMRRLRYPRYTLDGQPDTNGSEDGTTHIFTGGFGATDVFHTLAGALRSIERVMDEKDGKLVRAARDPNSLELLRVAFLEARRRRLVISGDGESTQRHAAQLIDGAYALAVIAARIGKDGRRISAETETALNTAFALDAEIEKKYGMPSRVDLPPGVGGFWISLLTAMQKEADANNTRSTRILDRDETSVMDPATFNRASAETIGTHSLLSKDAPEKEPMRVEAVALASFASRSIAAELLTRRPGDRGAARDWLAIARHYMRLPPERGGWEVLVLDAIDKGRPAPSPADEPDQPPRRLLSGASGRPRADLRQQLEKRYEALESRAEGKSRGRGFDVPM